MYYRMLRSALTTRRALILLDGIDEGGVASERLLTHIASVLAPQGHVLIATAHPSLLDADTRFSHFHQLTIQPLSEEKQQEAMIKRVGVRRARTLWAYAGRVLRNGVSGVAPYGEAPLDDDGVTSAIANPQMLAMLISIYLLVTGDRRAPVQLPIARADDDEDEEEDEEASLGAAALDGRLPPPEEAEDDEEAGAFVEAALAEAMPETLAQLYDLIGAAAVERASVMDAPSEDVTGGGPTIGGGVVFPHQLDALIGAIIVEAHLEHRTTIDAVQFKEAGRALEVRGVQGANGIVLRLLKQRVIEGRMPLLTVRRVDPLELQASHSSWTHFFSARAIRDVVQLRRPVPPPWQWDSSWAGVVRMGASIGNPFRDGLLRIAGIDLPDRMMRDLDLRGKLEPAATRTAIAGVAQIVRTDVLQRLDVTGYALTADERAEICRALRLCRRLNSLSGDRLSVTDGLGTTLELGNWFEKCFVRHGGKAALDDTDISLFARLVANGALRQLETLWLACDEVGEAAMCDLAEALSRYGALPNLRALYVSQRGYVHVKDACRRRRIQLSYPKDGMVEDPKDTPQRIVRAEAVVSRGARKTKKVTS